MVQAWITYDAIGNSAVRSTVNSIILQASNLGVLLREKRFGGFPQMP